MNPEILSFLPLVLDGAVVTVTLSLVSTVLAVLFGLLGAGARLSGKPLLRALGTLYVAVVRAVPDLVLMLLIFFGGQMLINAFVQSTGLIERFQIPKFAAGAFTIGLIFGSYMTETFRSAYLSIPRGQIEAARACGMRDGQWLRFIVWPQIVPLALPSFTNNYLVLMKTTALVSIIGLQDVTYTALQAGRTSREPFAFLIVAMLVYLLFTLISDQGLRYMERRYRVG